MTRRDEWKDATTPKLIYSIVHSPNKYTPTRLKLETSLSTSNMHLFNAEGQIVKYDSPLDVLKARPSPSVDTTPLPLSTEPFTHIHTYSQSSPHINTSYITHHPFTHSTPPSTPQTGVLPHPPGPLREAPRRPPGAPRPRVAPPRQQGMSVRVARDRRRRRCLFLRSRGQPMLSFLHSHIHPTQKLIPTKTNRSASSSPSWRGRSS